MIKVQDLSKENYKSGEVAKMLGVTTRTIQNYCINGLMQQIIVNNRRLIPRESVIGFLKSKELLSEENNGVDVIYARVSTHKQKNRGDLDRQIQRIKEYVIYQNPINLQVISDVGSGLNDKRKGLEKLLKMIQNNEVNRLFICYKDRLTRFGFNYIKSICDFHHTNIIIVSNEELDKSVSEELAEDIIAIIHSFSGKLYGMRRKIRDDICKELDDDGTSGES